MSVSRHHARSAGWAPTNVGSELGTTQLSPHEDDVHVKEWRKGSRMQPFHACCPGAFVLSLCQGKWSTLATAEEKGENCVKNCFTAVDRLLRTMPIDNVTSDGLQDHAGMRGNTGGAHPRLRKQQARRADSNEVCPNGQFDSWERIMMGLALEIGDVVLWPGAFGPAGFLFPMRLSRS